MADLRRIAADVLPAGASTQSLTVRTQADVAVQLRSFALDLLAGLRLHQASPTLKDEKARLDDIGKAAGNLLRALDGAPDRHGLARQAALAAGFFQQVPGPQGVTYEFAGGVDAVRRSIAALQDAAKATRDALDSPELGGAGRERLEERRHGGYRRHLARQCAWLLRECHGDVGVPVVNDGGPVLALAEAVWEFATGQPAPVGFLASAAKAGARDVRRDDWQPPPLGPASRASIET